ncbi:MAG TPA: hypothetical protein VIS72_03160 [Anaerolineales bacterium]
MSRILGNSGKLAVLIGLVIFLSGLVVFAYLGYYNRYWADDWCYNADFLRLGFMGTMRGYTYITTYASNRFSLTLFSGLLYYLDISGVQLMTLLVVLFLTWGLYRLLNNFNVMLSLDFSTAQLLLMTAIVVYYSISLAPHLYQSIYWRSGLLPYTAPLVFGVWVFALITSSAVRKIHPRLTAICSGVLAFLGGGFSEAGTATLTAMFVAFVFACFVFRRAKWSKDTAPFAIVALLASISAMVILIVSPTTAYRVDLYERSASLLEFPRLLLYYTYEFLVTNVLGEPLTHLVIFGTLTMVGALGITRSDNPIKTRTWFFTALSITVLTIIFVSASFSPSVYIELGLPALRTRVIAQFIFILGYGLVAVISGVYFGQFVHRRQLTWIIPIMLILFCVYGVRSVALSGGKATLYAERAAIWDERDLQIRQSKDQGILEIHVRGIDSLPVGGILDFTDKGRPAFWVNNCAIRYYGVEGIYASLP